MLPYVVLMSGDRIQPNLFHRRVQPGSDRRAYETDREFLDSIYQRVRGAEERLFGLKHDKWWTHNDPKSTSCPICDLLTDAWRGIDFIESLLDQIQRTAGEPGASEEVGASAAELFHGIRNIEDRA